MSYKVTMNNRLIRWFSFILFFSSFNTISAQWGFTATLRVIGKDCEGVTLTLPAISGFPDQSICEQVRRDVLAIRYSSSGCTAYYSCTACTGQDLNYNKYNESTNPLNSGFTRQFTPGTLSINGIAVGQAFFTPNNSLSIQEWIDNVQQHSALIENNPPINITPTTEDSRFDKTYQNDMIAYIGESKSPISIDPNKMKVKTFDYPSLKTPDMAKSMEIANISHEMQLALSELLRLERFKETFCNSSPSDCDYYQNKYNEANQTYLDAKEKLRALKYEEYTTELNNYKQQLDKCKKDQSEQNEFWEAQTQKQIDYLNEQIAKTTDNLNGIDTEIAAKENYINERDSQMSWADKTEEIANERLKRIDEKLLNGEISAANAILMRTNANEDIAAAKTARTVTDAYNYSKDFLQENKDMIVHGTIDVAEFVGHATVEIGAAVATPGTFGASQAGKFGAHTLVSTTADLLHQTYNNDGSKSTGAMLMDASRNSLIRTGRNMVIDRIIPIKITPGGQSVMHTNMTGQVVYQTKKGASITTSDFVEGFGTGLKYGSFNDNK